MASYPKLQHSPERAKIFPKEDLCEDGFHPLEVSALSNLTLYIFSCCCHNFLLILTFCQWMGEVVVCGIFCCRFSFFLGERLSTFSRGEEDYTE